ncbi:scarecrow-like protein 15 isoform X1 [Humulus lupulus]|uniref:scarecrow-like protein 15 isoform X1 n=1 Tax=Humulus lupulus TaxID=3486 RepID=UPI002B400999|nr:scarecrow-like protein 15 isoform X1 [Humulus lupulus]
MIVPVTTPQNNLNQSPSTKTDNNNNRNNSNNNSTHITNLCYEPTSVLDLRRSPSPVAGKPAKVSAVSDVVLSHATNESTLEWVDDQVLHNLDWDTIMRELGLHDDSVPAALKTSTTAAAAMATATTTTVVPQLNNPCVDPHQITSHFLEFPHPQPFDPTHLVHSTDFNFDHSSNSTFGSHHHNLNLFEVSPDFHLGINNNSNNNNTANNQNNNWSIGFDFIEDLIRVADCFDSDDLQLAQVILDRLNQRLRSGPSGKPVGRPFQRAALYFKEALQSILSGSNRTADRLSSWAEIVQTIRGYKAFSGISPIPMFSHFTTNQALLEALSGSTFIHVVDFDIGLGGQYASLMKELAEKSESLRVNPPILRITAVVPVEYAVESRLIRENLTQFSQELKIRFQIDFVLVRVFEALSFKAINFREGEKIAVLFSSAVLRRHGGGFLGEVRRVSPAVVVFVDGEGWGGEPGTAPTTSFRRNFVGGLEFYSMVMESLDAAMVGAELVRKIEAFVLRPKIIGMVEAAAAAGVGGGRRTASFREMFHGAGMRPVHLSQFADFQAECLLGKVQVRGFHVAKRQAELALCWHERALVATSVWRC